MRGARRAIVAGGAALAMATSVLVHRHGRAGPGLAPVPGRASAAAHGGSASAASAREGAAPLMTMPVDPGTPPARAAALRARLGAAAVPAEPQTEPAVLRALATYSAAELGAFARFERLTDRAVPHALLELVRLRRDGAADAELVAEASRLFAGDPLGRAAALDVLSAASR